MPTFFTAKTFVFIGVNAVRFFSILAICLALSGELVVMINDIEGYKASQTIPSPVSSVDSAAPLRRRSSPPYPLAYVQPNLNSFPGNSGPNIHTLKVERIYRSLKRRESTDSASTMADGTPSYLHPFPTSPTAIFTGSKRSASSSVSSSTTPAEGDAIDSTCSYVGNTSVPKQTGGILFATLDRIFCCVVLAAMLLSEMPPPIKLVQRFWQWAFPPFGDAYGVGILGLLQMFVGCSILSHSLPPFPTVGGWFLFVVSFLNLLLGVGLGTAIKEMRSVFSPPSPSSHRSVASKFSTSSFKSRPLSAQGALVSGHTTPSPAYFPGAFHKPEPQTLVTGPAMEPTSRSSSFMAPTVPGYFSHSPPEGPLVTTPLHP